MSWTAAHCLVAKCMLPDIAAFHVLKRPVVLFQQADPSGPCSLDPEMQLGIRTVQAEESWADLMASVGRQLAAGRSALWAGAAPRLALLLSSPAAFSGEHFLQVRHVGLRVQAQGAALPRGLAYRETSINGYGPSPQNPIRITNYTFIDKRVF